VAMKVLPEEFAKDADRVARFQREAKVIGPPTVDCRSTARFVAAF